MIEIHVDASKVRGRIRALHGVNNGPVCYGSLVDVSDQYQRAAFPSIRLHDTNWPHPREVDIPCIFPDVTKDPADPGSYEFERTDKHRASAVKTGAQLIYRLGVSIEHTDTVFFTNPPPATSITRFLDYCQSRHLPLDFFSWHACTNDPCEIQKKATRWRENLDRHQIMYATSHGREQIGYANRVFQRNNATQVRSIQK